MESGSTPAWLSTSLLKAMSITAEMDLAPGRLVTRERIPSRIYH